MWLRIQDDSKTSRTSLGGDATFCFWFVHETLMWQWQHNNASIGIILLVKRNVMLRSLHLERVGRMIDSTYIYSTVDAVLSRQAPTHSPLTTHTLAPVNCRVTMMVYTQQNPSASIIMILPLLLTSVPKGNGFQSIISTNSRPFVSKVIASSHRKPTSAKLTSASHQRPTAVNTCLIRLSSSSSMEREAITNNNERDDTTASTTWQNPRSRWARRKHRRKMEKLQRDERGEDEDEGGDDAGALHWDKFEFGDRYVHMNLHRL